MKATIIFFTIFPFAISIINAQSFSKLKLEGGCSYFGERYDNSTFTLIDPDSSDIIYFVKLILGNAVKNNILVQAASVPNASAQFSDKKRIIYYSPEFFDGLKAMNDTNFYWTRIAILAHEIGHHYNNDLLEYGKSNPESELHADKFSGYQCAKLGASLLQAQSAIRTLNIESDSSTHPPNRARLSAIAAGWKIYKSEQKLPVSYVKENKESDIEPIRPEIKDFNSDTSNDENLIVDAPLRPVTSIDRPTKFIYTSLFAIKPLNYPRVFSLPIAFSLGYNFYIGARNRYSIGSDLNLFLFQSNKDSLGYLSESTSGRFITKDNIFKMSVNISINTYSIRKNINRNISAVSSANFSLAPFFNNARFATGVTIFFDNNSMLDIRGLFFHYKDPSIGTPISYSTTPSGWKRYNKVFTYGVGIQIAYNFLKVGKKQPK